MVGSSSNRPFLILRGLVFGIACAAVLASAVGQADGSNREIVKVLWVAVALALLLVASTLIDAEKRTPFVGALLAAAEVGLVALLVGVSGQGPGYLILLFFTVAACSLEHGLFAGQLSAFLAGFCLYKFQGTILVPQALGLLGLGSLGLTIERASRLQSRRAQTDSEGQLESAQRIAREQSRARELREQELFQERRKLEGLMDVAHQLVVIREPRELMSTIVRCAAEQMEVSVAIVLLVEGESLVVSRAIGVSELALDRLGGPMAECYLGRVLLHGEVLSFNSQKGRGVLERFGPLGNFESLLPRDTSQPPAGYARRTDILRNLLAVPLKTPQDRVPLGLLLVANRRLGDDFCANDEGYLRILATDAAIAIRNIHYLNQLERTHFELIQTLAQAIEAKDLYTGNHVGRVRELAVRTAEVLGLERETIKEIGIAAMLHDVGKISTPDRILSKPGSLDAAEFETMKAHARNGMLILRNIRSLPESVPRMVLHHHERWDGKGYPDGLRAEEIPVGAQIIAVSDCFDAMTTDRPYRRGFSPEEALTRMENGCGTQFNAKVLCAFFAMFGYEPRHNALARRVLAEIRPHLNLGRAPTFDHGDGELVAVGAKGGSPKNGELTRGGASPGLVNSLPTKERPRVLQIETGRPRLQAETTRESSL